MTIPPQGCQRLFSRVPFHAPVRLHLQGQILDVELLDIALRGALVRIGNALPVGLQEPCTLVLPLAAGDDAIEMRGIVVHLEDHNVGISCQDIDVASLTSLRRLLELNTGDPDLMDRELSLLFAKR